MCCLEASPLLLLPLSLQIVSGCSEETEQNRQALLRSVTGVCSAAGWLAGWLAAAAAAAVLHACLPACVCA